jgi:hypothetical protein
VFLPKRIDIVVDFSCGPRSMKKSLFVAVSMLSVVAGHSAVVVVAPTASTAGSLIFTDDFTFTITTGVSTGRRFFVLDEWVTSDGQQDSAAITPQVVISKNGGAPTPYTTQVFYDNLSSVLGTVTQNDGYFSIITPTLATSDTLTIKAGSYSLAATANFNPQGSKTFTGNMFVTTDTGTRISNVVTVTVPEPATSTLLVVAGIAMLAKRRRRVTV